MVVAYDSSAFGSGERDELSRESEVLEAGVPHINIIREVL